MTKLTSQEHFNALWLAETIRLQEESQGDFADSEAVRQAQKEGGDFQTRILTRAQWLANKTNLIVAQQSAITAMQWSVKILCALAFFLGMGLILPTFSVADHTINIFSALGCLLGLNFLMLVVWILSTVFGGQSINQLGRLVLWLTNKLTGKKQVAQLMPAFFGLLHQRHLERWLLGRLTNGLWLLISIFALISLLSLLATQRYGFVWQTTILGDSHFVTIVNLLGSLPQWLGFPIPPESLIRQSGNTPVMDDAARQVWAAWLVGVLVVYGIFPRLILFLVCSGFWRYGYKRLQLDITKRNYHLLRSRLLPSSERLGITDPDNVFVQKRQPIINNNVEWGAMIIGVELELDYPWPPTIATNVIDAGIIETREQRKALLDQLVSDPVAKLLIVCDPKRSIDRGTLMLFSELAYCVAEARVWLLVDEKTDTKRLADWQQALEQLGITYADSDELLIWLSERT